MEEILEFIVEFIAELYLNFAESILPSDKEISKGKRIFLKAICVFVSICMMGCVIGGVVLLINSESDAMNIAGIVLLALAFVIVVANIIIALYNSKNKNNKLQ